MTLRFACAAGILLAAAACAQDITIPVPSPPGPPTAVGGVVYFAAGPLLHAVRAADGTAVPGFPVDIVALTAPDRTLHGRPVVYFGDEATLGIYLSTDQGDVVRVNADGTPAWVYHAVSGTGGRQPAVTPAGDVFVTVGSQVVKLRQDTGGYVIASVPLSSEAVVSSLAVDGSCVYAGVVSGPGEPKLAVLNITDLTVRSTFFDGAETNAGADPCIVADGVFVGTRYGHLYKLNRVTLSPDETFGAPSSPGRVTADVADLFPYGGPSGPRVLFHNSYAASLLGSVDAATGEVAYIETGGPGQHTAGSVAVPARRLAAYTSAFAGPGGTDMQYLFTQAPMDGVGAPVTNAYMGLGQPTYDAATNRFFVNGFDAVLGFNSIR